MNIMLKEARERKEVLLRELKVLDNFISFYEGRSELPEEIDPSLTLKQLVARKQLSVRLANCLLDHFNDKGENTTIGHVLKALGNPMQEETEIDLLKAPNFGRKGLNELKDLLGRVTK